MGVKHGTEFADAYERSLSTVTKAAYTVCGDKGLAEDAAQEAFVRALVRWGRLRGEDYLVGWLASTAMNVARGALRRKKLLGLAGTIPTSTVESHDDRVLMERSLVIQLALLPRRQREAVVLYYVVDLSIGEIAQLMSCSNGSVKSHLARARATLGSLIEERTYG